MYSQNAEEQYILQACPEAQGKFLDVGAWDAIKISNTRALFERGWNGVLIEPSPTPFSRLYKQYANSLDRVILINAAVALAPGVIQMWITEEGMTTSERQIWEKHRLNVIYESVMRSMIAITLEQIYAANGPFDFVSLDTEGTSVDLLRRLIALQFRPRCICVEHDDRRAEVAASAAEGGYAEAYYSAENIVLVRRW